MRDSVYRGPANGKPDTLATDGPDSDMPALWYVTQLKDLAYLYEIDKTVCDSPEENEILEDDVMYQHVKKGIENGATHVLIRDMVEHEVEDEDRQRVFSDTRATVSILKHESGDQYKPVPHKVNAAEIYNCPVRSIRYLKVRDPQRLYANITGVVNIVANNDAFVEHR